MTDTELRRELAILLASGTAYPTVKHIDEIFVKFGQMWPRTDAWSNWFAGVIVDGLRQATANKPDPPTGPFMKMDAGDLLFADLCVPGCLLAMSTVAEQCVCRCDGRFHGVLIGTRIPAETMAAAS